MLPNPAPVERRRSRRIHLQVPVFTRGTDAAGSEFLDLTKTLEISATGALLLSPRALLDTQILYLTVPVPSSPGSPFPAETPPIPARIRRQQAVNGAYLLGVEFLRTLD